MILITFLQDIALPVIGVLIGFIVGHILWMLVDTRIKKWINDYEKSKEISRILSLSERYKIYIDVRDYILKSKENEFVFICNRLNVSLLKRRLGIYSYEYNYPLQDLFPELKLIKPRDKKYGEAWWPKEDKQSRINALDEMIYAVLQKDNKL